MCTLVSLYLLHDAEGKRREGMHEEAARMRIA
jgi:hypothetical protein